jgi:hypothetical protein
MLGRPRLDPFSARLLAIHRKGRPVTTGAVDDVLTEIAKEKAAKAQAAAEAEGAEGAEGAEEDPQSSAGPKIFDIVDEFDPEDDPEFAAAMRAAMEAQKQMDTGCADCAESFPTPSLADALREIKALKARVAELESRVLPDRSMVL